MSISDHTHPLFPLKNHENGVKNGVKPMSFCPIFVEKQIKSVLFQCFLRSAAFFFGLYPATCSN